MHIDVSGFYSPKGGYDSNKVAERKFVVGLSIQLVKQVSTIDAVTAGAEIYYDDGLHTIKKVFLNDAIILKNLKSGAS